MSLTTLRWGRIVLGGVLAELILILIVIPMRALNSSESAITNVAVVGSFLVFVPVAGRLCRTTDRPVLHGLMMGAVAAAFYILLAAIGRLFVADVPPTPWIYYVAHALKLTGGATGGWLAQRSKSTASMTARLG